MKNLNNKEFTINKSTIRDLTPNEQTMIGGASHPTCPPCPPAGVPMGDGDEFKGYA
jgi:hypothetical protein